MPSVGKRLCVVALGLLVGSSVVGVEIERISCGAEAIQDWLVGRRLFHAAPGSVAKLQAVQIVGCDAAGVDEVVLFLTADIEEVLSCAPCVPRPVLEAAQVAVRNAGARWRERMQAMLEWIRERQMAGGFCPGGPSTGRLDLELFDRAADGQYVRRDPQRDCYSVVGRSSETGRR